MKKRGICIFLIIIFILGAAGSVWYLKYGKDLLKKVSGLSKVEYIECKSAQDYNSVIDNLMKKDEFKDMSVDERGEKVADYLKQLSILNKKDGTGVGLKKDSIKYYSEMGAVVYNDEDDYCNIILVRDYNDMTFSNPNYKDNNIDKLIKNNEDNKGDDTDNLNILLLYDDVDEQCKNDYIDTISQYEQDENINISLTVDDEVTVEDYMNKLSAADIVIIAAHGLYGYTPDTWFTNNVEKTQMICTNEKVTVDNKKKYSEKLKNHSIVMTKSFANIGNKYYMVLPELFTNSYSENELNGEFIYLCCCEMLGKYNESEQTKYDTKMVQVLLDCGADSVAAYYNDVFKYYALCMLDSILDNLIDGNTLLVAVDNAKEEYGADNEQFAEVMGWLDEEYKTKNQEVYEKSVLKCIGDNSAAIGIYGDEEYCINVRLQDDEEEKIDAQAMWTDFLANGKYQKLIDEYNYEGETASEIMEVCENGYRYVLSDLDGDGIDELLLEKTRSDGQEWKYTWTFVISDGNIICVDERFGYDSYRKSSADNTIVVSLNVRPSIDYYQYDFYRIESNQYVIAYSIIKDSDHVYYDDGDTTKDIEDVSEELNNIEDFDWKILEADNQQNEALQHTTNKSIPDGAVTYNGHSYYCFDNGIQTWHEAEAYCESLGGHLAVIEDADENNFLYNYMLSCGLESAYFGCSDFEEEGNWKWVVGNSTYFNWAEAEPNSETENEDYAMFYYKYTDGKWNDGDFADNTADGGKAYICEW